jgi:hypothetical protein
MRSLPQNTQVFSNFMKLSEFVDHVDLIKSARSVFQNSPNKYVHIKNDIFYVFCTKIF